MDDDDVPGPSRHMMDLMLESKQALVGMSQELEKERLRGKQLEEASSKREDELSEKLKSARILQRELQVGFSISFICDE